MSEATEKEQPQAPSKAPEEPPLPRAEGDELIAVLEALLFAATSPLSVSRLQRLTGDAKTEEIWAALEVLRERYESPTSGLNLMEVAGGFQLATGPEVADWVLALHKHRKKNPLTPAMLETLAIVAYKQPMVRAEIEAIRGVDCGGVLRALQDTGLVEIIGQRETVGRPALYATTETFLKTFGLRDLGELPSLAEFQKILNTSMKGPEEQAAEETDEAEGADAEIEAETEAAPEVPEADEQEEPTAEQGDDDPAEPVAEAPESDADSAPDSDSDDEEPKTVHD